MIIDLSLRDIRKGLEDNLKVLADTRMGKYVRYGDLAEDQDYRWKIDEGKMDMDKMNWSVLNVGRALGVMPHDKSELFSSGTYLNFQAQIYQGLKIAQNNLLNWMQEETSKLGNFVYNHSKKFKSKKDQQREDMIKGIISWECLFDAYIVSLHKIARTPRLLRRG